MTRIHIESEHKGDMARLVKNSLAMQRKVLQAGLRRTKDRLKVFEREFNQTSQAFYQAYEKGERGDDEKVMEWAGEWETYQELKKSLDLLKGARIC